MPPANDLQAKRTQLSLLAEQWREWPFEIPSGVAELEDVNEFLAVAVVAGRAIACPAAAASWVSNMSPWLQAWVRDALPEDEASLLRVRERRRGRLLMQVVSGPRPWYMA